MKENTCCFIGHLWLPKDCVGSVFHKLAESIDTLIQSGVTVFLSGGSPGFDKMAASLVASKKENNPIIRLKLIPPYPGYDKAWPEGDRIHFRHILSKADSMEFFSATSSDDCIAKRDRYMIEQSAFCICALYTEDGGLADTLRYARSKNLKIINVAK